MSYEHEISKKNPNHLETFLHQISQKRVHSGQKSLALAIISTLATLRAEMYQSNNDL